MSLDAMIDYVADRRLVEHLRERTDVTEATPEQKAAFETHRSESE